MKRGNLIAWLAFTTGAVVSIGANVLHALDGGGAVDFGRVVAAGWAPVALLLVAELVARARQSGPWWIITLRWSGTAVVAGVAAIVSYGHMRDLLLSYGETPLVAHLLPLSVDGLLLVASLALASPDGTGRCAGETIRQADGTERTSQAPAEKGAQIVRTPEGPVEEGRQIVPTPDTPAGEGERIVTLATPVPVLAANGTRGTVTVPVGDAQEEDGKGTQIVGPPIEEVSDERAQARQAYRAALVEGVTLTGKELAARFGRSESWGRTRIRECAATS